MSNPLPDWYGWDPEAVLSKQLYGENQQLKSKQGALQDQLNSLVGGKTGGYGGLGYSPLTGVKGLPEQFFGPQGYGGAAQDILKGSVNADRELHDAYSAILRHKSEGIFGGLGMETDRASSQAEAAGYSPELARMANNQRGALAQQQFGEAAGGAASDLHTGLAELMKGTGTELAGLKQYELGSVLNALVGQQTAAAASKGAGANAFGSLLGGAGKLIGGLALL